MTDITATANTVRPLIAPSGDSELGGAFTVRILQFLRRWRWLILGVAAGAVLIGIVLTLLATPQYTASATLEIRRENFRITSAQGVEPEAAGVDQEFYQTQYGLLQTRAMSESVARAMKIDNDPAFFEKYGAAKVAEQIRAGGLMATSPGSRTDRTRVAGEILRSRLNVTPTRASRLVTVSIASPDPAFSQKVANTWTRVFIETTLDRKFEATSYARKFLENRLEQLRQRLEESERLLVSYASKQGIINLPVPSVGVEGATIDKPIVAENLEVLNRELAAAIADRVKAESRLTSVGGSTSEALNSTIMADLRAKRAELVGEYSKILTQFEPQYGPARAIQAQIEQIDRALNREEARISSTIRGTFTSAIERESALKRQVATLKSDLLDVRGRSIQYNIYQREVDTNRQLYDGLLQRYKEIGVAGGVGVNNISIIDSAYMPESPSSPNLVINLMVAMLAGLALGVAAALVLDQIDESVSDPRSVESTFGAPLFGIIPKVDSENPRDELSDRKSALVEAYLSAQSSLSFSTSHGAPRSIAVTSTRAAEGKSTSSLALALMLARAGRKVILVDGDMRSPSVHHLTDLKNVAGLSNYLAGSDDLVPLIQRGSADGFAIMTAGPLPPNAAELLSSTRLTQLIETLGHEFDHVLFDIPPVMGLADAPLIARAVEGTIFVIQSHSTGASAGLVAMRRLRDVQANIVGILLTKFQAERAHYGAGYEYGYGYGQREETA